MPSTSRSPTATSRRELLAALGSATLGGLAGCSALDFDDSPPEFDPEQLRDVLDRPTPEFDRPAPAQPTAEAIDAGLDRGDGLLGTVPSSPEDDLPDEHLREEILERLDRASNRRDAVREASDRFRALIELCRFRRDAREATTAYQIAADRASADGSEAHESHRNAVERERSEVRAAVDARLASVDYAGEDRDRTLLAAIRLEEELETARRLFRRRTDSDRPPALALGRLAGRTEYGRAWIDAADELAARRATTVDEPVDFAPAFDLGLERWIDETRVDRFPDEDAEPADVVGDAADRLAVQSAVGISMNLHDRMEAVVEYARRNRLGLGLDEAVTLKRDRRAHGSIVDRVEAGEFPEVTVGAVRAEREAAIDAVETVETAGLDPSERSLWADALVRTARGIDSIDAGIRWYLDRDLEADLATELGRYALVRARIEALPEATAAVRERLDDPVPG